MTALSAAPAAPTPWLSDLEAEVFLPDGPLPERVGYAVVGGGLMGIASAYWLAREGADVLLLESRWLAWGASGRNAGLMLHSTSDLESSTLVTSVLAEEEIAAEYTRSGHLALASSREIWGKILAEIERRPPASEPLHALTLEECMDLLHLKIAPRFLGGRWLPGGRAIHPGRFVFGLARAAVRRGARVVAQTPVLAAEPAPGNGEVLLTTHRGNVRARAVLYAAGAWTPELVPALRPAVQTVRGQMLATNRLQPLFGPGMAVDWGTVYWRQIGDGTIVLGGLSHLSPTETGCRDETVNLEIQAALERVLPEAFPDLPPLHVERRWAGLMDYTLDGRPIADRVPGRPNEWILFGFGGHGMPAGLACGREMARSLMGEALTPPLKGLALARLDGRLRNVARPHQ